ncbi:MAG: hypothetical protein AAF211_33020 [Myxococcota bacterium]
MTHYLPLFFLLGACTSSVAPYGETCADQASETDAQLACLEDSASLARADADEAVEEARVDCESDRDCLGDVGRERECTRGRIEREREAGEEAIRRERFPETRRARLLERLENLGIEVDDLREALRELREARRERRQDRRERRRTRRDRCGDDEDSGAVDTGAPASR